MIYQQLVPRYFLLEMVEELGPHRKDGIFKSVGTNFDLIHTIPTITGDSGGPIFNSDNEVIGINWGGIKDTEINYGASFLNLKWIKNSMECFNTQSRMVAVAASKNSFWEAQSKVISPKFITATRRRVVTKNGRECLISQIEAEFQKLINLNHCLQP